MFWRSAMAIAADFHPVGGSAFGGSAFGGVSNGIAKFAVLAGVPLLFLPKINLVSIGNNMNAGLRIDDLVLAIVTSVLISGFVVARRSRLLQCEVFLLLYVALGLFANFVIGGSPLFTLRSVEYFIFFWVGIYAARFLRMRDILLALLLINLLIVPFQAAGLVGSFALGRITDTTGANAGPKGLMSGHWELSAVFNIAFAALAFGNQLSRRSVFLLAAAMAVCMTLMGSRTPIVILVLLVGLYAVRGARLRPHHMPALILGGSVATAAAIAIGAVLWDPILENTQLVQRLSTLGWDRNVSIVTYLWRLVPAGHDSSIRHVVERLFHNGGGGDLSLLRRASTLFAGIKLLNNEGALGWLVGMGPGAFGNAIDCGIVRIVFESGIVGAVLFWALILSTLRYSVAWPYILLAFVLTNTTLDGYLAYKIMSVMFLISGMSAGAVLNSASLHSQIQAEHPAAG